jgi:hypothetical protein
MLTVSAGGRPEFSPLPETPSAGFETWLPLITVRAGAGYRSNPQFAYQPMGTGFGTSGLDLFLIRTPADGTTASLFFSGEDVRYFQTLRPVTNEAAATKEQTFITDLRVGRTLGSTTNWAVKLEGRHVYNDQFLNTSSFDSNTTNLSSLHAAGHTATFLPSVEWRPRPEWRMELAGVGSRQYYLTADPETGLSSIWEGGPRLTVGWRAPRVGLWELEFSGVHREFDHRVQDTQLGLPLADTRLRQDDLRVELLWRRDWDAGRHWQTLLRPFWVRRQENGDGYTDFDRWGVNAQIRYESKHWSAKLAGRWSSYAYPHSYVVESGILAVLRERSTWQAEARLAWTFWSASRVFTEYSFETEHSNRISDRYSAHVVTLGIEHDF